MEKKQYIEAGKIVNTHGVHGEVKIQVWLDSPEFMRRFKTLYIDSKPVKLISSRSHKGFLIALLDGVEDINAAMSLKNKTVYIDRADAPLRKGEYFLCDIIGASVVTEDGESVGCRSRLLLLHDILPPALPHRICSEYRCRKRSHNCKADRGYVIHYVN